MNSESSRLSIKDTRKAYIFLLLTFVLWGSLYVVSKYVLGKLPAFTIAFLRFLFAFAALSLFDRHPGKKLEKQHIPYILLIGFGGYFIAVGAQLLGTKYAGASTASLINSMNPVTMTLFGAIILHEQLTIRKILGIALSILGVFVVLGGGIRGTGTAGILFSLFSVLLWSLVSVLTRKVTQLYPPLHISRLAIGLAAVCYLPAALIESGVSHAPVLLDAGVCSSFYPVQPAVSTLLGILLLGETLTVHFLLGSALIVCGVLLGLSSSFRHSSPDVS